MIEIPHLPDPQHLLHASSLQHRVISNNLANTNTPGYLRQQVDFAAVVSRLGETQSSARLHSGPPIVIDAQAIARQDGNTVDPDREIGELGKNTLRYQALLHLAAHQIQQMQTAIGRT